MGDPNGGEKRKAVARCPNCGAVAPVRVWSDGSVHPLGSGELCGCDGPLEVLDDEIVDDP